MDKGRCVGVVLGVVVRLIADHDERRDIVGCLTACRGRY